MPPPALALLPPSSGEHESSNRPSEGRAIADERSGIDGIASFGRIRLARWRLAGELLSVTPFVGCDPLLGRVLGGKYELVEAIGSGATGFVYRARQLSLQRDVAVKLLQPSCVNRAEVVGRFRLEARAASMLSHPGIVTVLDWGEEPDGLLYLVVEYLPGADLFDIAHAEGPFSSQRIAKLMTQVARALSHAHAHGVIHRDLKPENLRILRDKGSGDEVVKIYDFGTAFVAGVIAEGVTETGMVVGTPDYFSPEQAAARPVGPRSDIYSCGVIMFLLATGSLPFRGRTTVELARMHVATPPPKPSRLRPDIDPRLESVILQCLAKRPADRPSSALRLAAMLAPLLEEPKPEVAVPVSRGAALWGVATGAAVAAIAGLSWVLSSGTSLPLAWLAPSGAADDPSANEAAVTVDGGQDAAPPIAPEATQP